MEKSCQILKRYTLSSKTKRGIIDSVSYLFIFLFVYTAYDKGMEYSSFSKSLGRYSMIRSYTDQLAWMIPAAEVFVSGLLLFPKTRRLGLIGALTLMLSFTSFLLYVVFSMEAQYCSCGGVISNLSASQHIWFNSAFIALATIGILLSKNKINEQN